MHINEPPRSPRQVNLDVSEPLNALTLKLLAKDLEDRYPSAAALANDLERVRSGLPWLRLTLRQHRWPRHHYPHTTQPRRKGRRRLPFNRPLRHPLGRPDLV